MPIPIGQLIKGSKYVVTRVGATKPTMTGIFKGTRWLRVSDWPRSTRVYSVLAARIANANHDGRVYNDKYTFELAAPAEAAAAAAGGAAAAAKLGGRRRRKTKKSSKRRTRKTRRRHK